MLLCQGGRPIDSGIKMKFKAFILVDMNVAAEGLSNGLACLLRHRRACPLLGIVVNLNRTGFERRLASCLLDTAESTLIIR